MADASPKPRSPSAARTIRRGRCAAGCWRASPAWTSKRWSSARRRRRAQGAAAAVAVDPGAVPDARRHQGLGHAGDRRVPQRSDARSGLLPADRAARAHCRAICGEMHSGFASLRSALPMNLKRTFPTTRSGPRAQADIERIVAIWRDCLDALRRAVPVRRAARMADAMYAPVVTRFLTYDVTLDAACAAYCETHHGAAGDAANGSPPHGTKPRTSKSSTWSSDHAHHADFAFGQSPAGHRAGPVDVDGLEVRRADDLEVFHVGRVVEQVVHDARPLVHAVAGRDQRLLVAVHEARPALEHDDDVEVRLMAVPSGALFRCVIGPHELREHPPAVASATPRSR